MNKIKSEKYKYNKLLKKIKRSGEEMPSKGAIAQFGSDFPAKTGEMNTGLNIFRFVYVSENKKYDQLSVKSRSNDTIILTTTKVFQKIKCTYTVFFDNFRNISTNSVI